METVVDAKRYLRDNWEKGTDCPCCGQLVKLYKRKLTSGMARALISLYKETKGDIHTYVHISRLGRLNGGEFAQLKRWGLIWDQESSDPDVQRTSGKWAITAKGVQFVTGLAAVPKYVYTYNMKTIGKSENQLTTISQALGNRFNYADLMAGV